MPKSPVTLGRVLRLALPAAAAAAATPLLGVVDAGILGRSSAPLEVGAVGLAGAVFSTLYWTFAFLRMSTAALSAQAVGEDDEQEARAVLARSVGLGVLIGVALLVLRPVIGPIAFAALQSGSTASPSTFAAARTYFEIRLWAAPAALGTYAAVGWLTGRGRTAVVMLAAIVMTGLNAILDAVFVIQAGWGAAGIALGTAIAEVVGLVCIGLGVVLVLSEKGIRAHWTRAFRWDPATIGRLLVLNRDIFIRTLLLVAAFAFFTQRSSGWGDVVLSANQILLQLFLLTGLALDGPAIAAESLVGQAVARRDREDFRATLRYTGLATAMAAAPFAAAYGLGGGAIIDAMSTSAPIREAGRAFMPWVAVSPLVVALCFLLDGIFVGAARSRDMRDAMLISAAAYLAAWWAGTSLWGPHGHWAAFLTFFVVRGITLLVRVPRIDALLATAR